MALPPYINYPGNLAYEQPFIMKDLQLNGFVVTGSKSSMQKMIDARLNFMQDRPDTKYFVASDKIIFAFTQSPFLQSLVPAFKAMGRFTEITFCSYIFLVECTRKDGEWWAQRMLFYIPYILVNTPLTLIGGREDYGFPKTMGEFIYPADISKPDLFSVSTIGMQHFSEHAVAGMHEFITIKKTTPSSGGSGSGGGVLKDLGELWSALKEVLTPSEEGFHIGLNFLKDEAIDLWKRRMQMVFMRQFRDIGDPSKACYQAIIESSGYPDNLRDISLIKDPYTVLINHMDTLPIDVELGLGASNTVSHAFAVKFDASFDDGKEIYRAV